MLGWCSVAKGDDMADKRKRSWIARFNYWFDNKMAQGFWPKVRLLLIVTLAYVVVFGTIAELATEGPVSGDKFFTMFMFTLGKSSSLQTSELSSAPVFFVLKFITIFYCMFFTAILIGLISNAIRSKVEELGKGTSQVLEDGHTLILGFNEASLELIRQIIVTDRNQKKPRSLVVLGKEDRSVMAERIRKRFGRPMDHPKTQIICRTGSSYDFDDLARCSLETSRVVIVSSEDDFEAVKTVMACAHILRDLEKDRGPYLVAVMYGEENLLESRIATHGEVSQRFELLSLNEVLARIMVHTSRQPGLSDVFTELFNFEYDEFYIFDQDPNFSVLCGKSIAEINNYLQMSFAVGVCKPVEGVVIGPPHEVFFEEGDSLVVVKADDDPLQVSRKPSQKVVLSPVPIPLKETVEVLIIGVQPILVSILKEYAEYLTKGSTIYIVGQQSAFDTTVTPAVLDLLEQSEISIQVRPFDASRKVAMDALLDETDPDCVVVLVDHGSKDQEAEDERIMRMLIYLRDYRVRNHKGFSITSEMLGTHNKELAAATEPDDFIVSCQFAALIMAQISQKREINELFNDVLSSHGFEVYMKPASWYVPLGERVDLVSVSQSVADCDEVFIGLRQKVNGRYGLADINPPKYAEDLQTKITYTFGPDDYLVVLAESSDLRTPNPR